MCVYTIHTYIYHCIRGKQGRPRPHRALSPQGTHSQTPIAIPAPRIQNPNTLFLHPESKLHNPKSKIRNPRINPNPNP